LYLACTLAHFAQDHCIILVHDAWWEQAELLTPRLGSHQAAGLVGGMRRCHIMATLQGGMGSVIIIIKLPN
jgi:hypothetical protein